MEFSEIPIWQYALTIWSTSWIMTIFRTWGRIKWLLETKFPRHPVVNTPILHFFVYIVSINFVLIAAGIPIMFSDTQRDKWVKAYVTSVGKRL